MAISKVQTIRAIALAIVFIALGVVLSPFTSIPVGVAKVNPLQAFINVLAAVLIGTWGAGGVATAIASFRNIFKTGTFFAFPGSIVGAVLAGLAFRWFKRPIFAALGEIIGTGLIAPVIGALLFAPSFLTDPKDLPKFWGLAASFAASTVSGAVLAVIVIFILQKARLIPSTAKPTSDSSPTA